MNIQQIEKLSKALNKYSKRRSELDCEPTTVDIFADKALNFHAVQIDTLIKEIAREPNKQAKKSSKKKS